MALETENSGLMAATMRDYRALRVKERPGEIGNLGPGDRCRGMLVEHDVRSPVGPDGFGGSPQEGLRGSEVEGGKSRPVVLGLPSAAALVTPAQVQNFLKHSLPLPSRTRQSAACVVPLASGAI
jgi:hypothetical protein